MRDISFVDFNEDEPQPIYCPICKEKFGDKVRLGPKLIFAGAKREADHDQWLQCPSCAWLCPIYAAEPEPTIKDSAETIQSPFETGAEVPSVPNRKTLMEKQKRKQAITKGVTKPRSRRFQKKEKIDPDIASEKGEVKIVYDSSH